MKEIRTVSLIGLGAIGCFLADGISKVPGIAFCVIAGGERKERLEKNGVIINGRQTFFQVTDPAERTGPSDLVIIIPKMTQLNETLADIKNQVGPDTILMSPLNGVESEEKVAAVYGEDPILWSLVRISSVRNGNRINFDTSTAVMEYGEKKDNTVLTDRVKAVNALMKKAGIRTRNPADMERAIWEKYVCNVSENQVSALLGIPFKFWRSSEDANKLRLLVADEVIAVAHKKGIMVEDDYAVKHLERLKSLPPENMTSTLQDIKSGRKTEVEMFGGTMMRFGRELGVPTPLNEFLYHAIKVLEKKNDGGTENIQSISIRESVKE